MEALPAPSHQYWDTWGGMASFVPAGTKAFGIFHALCDRVGACHDRESAGPFSGEAAQACEKAQLLAHCGRSPGSCDRGDLSSGIQEHFHAGCIYQRSAGALCQYGGGCDEEYGTGRPPSPLSAG